MLSIISLMLIFLSASGAYLLKFATGFGASLVLLPVLSMFVDIKTAVIMCALGDLISSGVMYKLFKKQTKWNLIIYVLLGLLVGTLIGTAIFKHIDVELLQKLFGAGIILYVGYQLLTVNRNLDHKFKPKTGLLFGIGAGITGGILNINGPLLVIFMNGLFKNKEEARSNLIPLFFIDSIWRIALFVAQGQINVLSMQMFEVSILPALIIGILVGLKLDKKIKDHHFQFISKLVLLLSGVKMLLI